MKNPLLLVTCLMACGAAFSQKTDSAQFYYKKAIEEKKAKRFLVSSNYLSKAVQFNPRYTEAFLESGFVNLEMRKTDAALSDFKKVAELEPSNTAVVQELMNLNYSYHQYQQTLQYAAKCKACTNSQRMIGLSNFQLGNFGNAIKVLVNVVDENPKDAESNYALAKSYAEVENFEESYTYFKKAVQLDATRTKWAYELGNLYFSHEKYKEATVYLNKAIDNGFQRNNDINETIGYAYLFTPEFDKGEKLLLSVLANKPGNITILELIADAFYHQKNYDKSISYWQKIIDIRLKDAKALYQQGLCYQKKGEKERGQELCNKAIDMDPSLSALRQKKMNVGL